jgi:DNA-binding CsgD family transcriptional regulator
MRLGPRPLRVRIEAEGGDEAELLARAADEGFVLAAPGEDAELIARPSHIAVESAGKSACAPRGAPGIGSRNASVLSPRELEILDYLVDGWSNAEIASALRISVRTVRFHLEGIYGRLGVSRRGEAVREALHLGLVSFDA